MGGAAAGAKGCASSRRELLNEQGVRQDRSGSRYYEAGKTATQLAVNAKHLFSSGDWDADEGMGRDRFACVQRGLQDEAAEGCKRTEVEGGARRSAYDTEPPQCRGE